MLCSYPCGMQHIGVIRLRFRGQQQKMSLELDDGYLISPRMRVCVFPPVALQLSILWQLLLESIS